MHPILRIVGVAFRILGAINTFGGVVAGVWLVISSDWPALGFGIVGIFASHLLISLLLVPSLMLGGVAVKSLAKGDRPGTRTALLGSTLYVAVLQGAWCLSITSFFLNNPHKSPLLPMLLWTYGVSTVPWVFLAKKDQEAGGNEFSAVGTLFLQFGYIIGALLLLADPGAPERFVYALGFTIMVNWIIQMSLATRMLGLSSGPSALS